MNLIPQPQNIKFKDGGFKVSHDVEIILSKECGSSDLSAALTLREEIENILGIRLRITKKNNDVYENAIYLSFNGESGEGYSINVCDNGIKITGNSSTGLFYGIQTLRQLIRLYRNSIPAVEIKDQPHYKYRGFYHDITRGKVPTLETLKELCDRAAFYKLNQLQLYIEHSFAFKGFSEVWSTATPLTAEEILILDEYCKERNVELVPSISTFGHLYEVLNTKSFRHLCELDWKTPYYSWIDRQLHHTLDVSNPESMKFVENMIDEFIPLFTSNKFNICADETFDLGEGKNRENAEKVGKGKLYVDFLNKIINHVKKYDKEVMFWGDVILNHPEYLNDIPEDVVCLNWNYSPAVTDEGAEKISKSGHHQYVCPGVWGWNNMMNHMDPGYDNISKMIKHGKKYNADGVLNTDWGDFGHVNLFGNSMPGMIFGAALSWNPDDERNYENHDESVSLIEYGDTSKKLVGLLRDLSHQEVFEWLKAIYWMEYKLGHVELGEYHKKMITDINEEDVKKAYLRSIEIGQEILKLNSQMNFKDKAVDMKEFYISARGITLLNALCLIVKKYDFNQDVELILQPESLAENLEYWIYDYSNIWRIRNKESELFRIHEAIRTICSMLREYKQGSLLQVEF